MFQLSLIEEIMLMSYMRIYNGIYLFNQISIYTHICNFYKYIYVTYIQSLFKCSLCCYNILHFNDNCLLYQYVVFFR